MYSPTMIGAKNRDPSCWSVLFFLNVQVIAEYNLSKKAQKTSRIPTEPFVSDLLLDLAQYHDIRLDSMLNSKLGPVYTKCNGSEKLSTGETLSIICKNMNRKDPKTPSAKIVIGKLLSIIGTQESAMVDLSMMTKDLVTSVINVRKTLIDMNKVSVEILVTPPPPTTSPITFRPDFEKQKDLG